MTIDELLKRLNWFYSLELNQVDWYTSQSQAFQGTYAAKVLQRVAQIEQRHVDNLATVFKQLGYAPTLLGDVLAPVVGSIGGKAVSAAGLSNALRINTLIEKKAKKDYAQLIRDMRDAGLQRLPELKGFYTVDGARSLVDILKNHYIEEDLHMAWFIINR